jgi:hypothetical protein
MRQLPILALALAFLAPVAVAPALGAAESPYPVSELFPVEPGRNVERGFAVAVDGDCLAMGAPRDDANEMTKNSGAVYLFHWSGTTWDQEAKLLADPPRANAQLGLALALRNGVLAAGAPGEGAVYVFARQDGGWSQVTRLARTDPGAGAFGRSLALDGDRLAVGAVGVPDTAGGAVYLYRHSGDSWTLEKMVFPRAGQEGERFASAVSLAGNVLVVGAPGYDVRTGPPAADAGAVYVFQHGPAGWQEMARLLPPSLPWPAWQPIRGKPPTPGPCTGSCRAPAAGNAGSCRPWASSPGTSSERPSPCPETCWWQALRRRRRGGGPEGSVCSGVAAHPGSRWRSPWPRTRSSATSPGSRWRWMARGW